MSYIRPHRMGPPRFVRGWRAVAAEVARQRRLVASGDLRSLHRRGWGRETFGWARVQCADGLRWAWCGSSHICGGTWRNRSEREAAWEAAQIEARKT